MATNKDGCVKSYKFSAVTKNPYFKVEFDWEIENYNHNDASSIFLSPEILLPGFSWQFGLKNKPGTKSSEIFIRTSCDDLMFISGRCYHDLKNFFVHKNISKGDNTISGDMLMLSGRFLADLKVYRCNKKSFFLNKISSENKTNSLSDNFLRTKHILDKIKVMWESKTTDIRILVEDKTIPAHKFILLAMSPVLATRLQQPTDEENTIRISDTSFKAMELIVKSMYGLFPDAEALAEEDWNELYVLYEMSDYYQALDLRDICGRAMIKMLTIENAAQLLHISDCCEDDAMMKEGIDFCCKNFEEVSETDGWKTWIEKNPSLATYLRALLTSDD